MRKIREITNTIVILENITKIPPLPTLEIDSLQKSDHEIDAARLQNVGDTETFIDVSKELKDGYITVFTHV